MHVTLRCRRLLYVSMLSRAGRTKLRNRIWPYVVLRREFRDVPRAIRHCRRIAESDTDCMHVLICDHIGDFIYTMGYLDALKKQSGYKHITIYVTRKFAKLIGLYPGKVDHVEVLDERSMNALLKMSTSEHGARVYQRINNLRIVNPANAFTIGNYDYIVGYPNIVFRNCICYGCLRLVSDDNFNPPVLQGQATIAEKRILKNAVILIGQARYLPDIDPGVLKEIIEKIRAEGYEVYTSLETDSDESFEGTDGLVCSLMDLIRMAPEAKMILGVRCGIFDMLAYTDSRLMIIYTGSEAEKRFFSLKGAPQATANISEYSEQELLDHIRRSESIVD